jgi:hypothetical protein
MKRMASSFPTVGLEHGDKLIEPGVVVKLGYTFKYPPAWAIFSADKLIGTTPPFWGVGKEHAAGHAGLAGIGHRAN